MATEVKHWVKWYEKLDRLIMLIRGVTFKDGHRLTRPIHQLKIQVIGLAIEKGTRKTLKELTLSNKFTSHIAI